MTNGRINPELEILIFFFRGRKVMIDYDLAILYNVPTKRLKEQVRRNIQRFPDDFMFALTKDEKDQLVANCDRLQTLKHSSILPMVFTEQGVAMLSSVLRSEEAIQINIEIMRAFARYRSFLTENKEMRKEIRALDEKLNISVKLLVQRIDALQKRSIPARTPIGFKIKK